VTSGVSLKCPCCGNQPVSSFMEYWRGANAFRIQCRSCGRFLKANSITWGWLIGCIGVATAVFVFLFSNIGKFVVDGSVLKLCLALFVVACAIMSWLTGGYVAAGPDRAHEEGD